MRRRVRWGSVAIGALLGAAPVTVSREHGVEAQAAECQSGTCCPEERSTCVIGTVQVGDYYHKAKGSCTQAT